MNSLVKTSKAVLAVAMLSALFACEQEGIEEEASGGVGVTESAGASEAGTGNPALDSILGGAPDTVEAEEPVVEVEER